MAAIQYLIQTQLSVGVAGLVALLLQVQTIAVQMAGQAVEQPEAVTVVAQLQGKVLLVVLLVLLTVGLAGAVLLLWVQELEPQAGTVVLD
jgi:hypothetical protein